MKKMMCAVLLFLQILFSPANVYAEKLSSVLGKVCIIRSAMNNNYVVDVYYRGTDNGTNVQLYSYNGTPAQTFVISRSEKVSGYYKIVNTHSNKAIDVSGGIAGNEINVHIWDQNETDAQLFKFEDAGNGYYYIKNKLGYYLDVYGAKCEDWTNIQTFRKNNGNNQKWLLTSVGGTSETQTNGNTKQQYLQKYQTAKSNMAQVQNRYMQAMQSRIKTTQTVNPDDSEALERLTQEIRKVNSGVGEEYCKAFALAILEEVEEFKKNNSPKTYDIFNQRGLNEFFSDFIKPINKDVSVDGKKFYCKGKIYFGAYSDITVRKQNTGKTITLSWVKKDNEVKKICADYFERLKAINNDAWGNFRNALRDDLRDLLGKGSLLNEAVILALCNSEVSQTAMKDILATFKKFTKIELGNESFRDYMNNGYKITQLWNTFKRDLKSTVENGVNDGNDFIESAEKIKIAQEKLQAFKEALDRNYSSSSIEKAWGDFKSAYEVVGGSGIFGNWWLGVYKNDLIPIPRLED
ncbi:MAG: RICIN domain-containing protein [Synergistaceae bacterium]|nr:RICIN domain-containing protein [Synergistaceae bacterium]